MKQILFNFFLFFSCTLSSSNSRPITPSYFHEPETESENELVIQFHEAEDQSTQVYPWQIIGETGAIDHQPVAVTHALESLPLSGFYANNFDFLLLAADLHKQHIEDQKKIKTIEQEKQKLEKEIMHLKKLLHFQTESTLKELHTLLQKTKQELKSTREIISQVTNNTKTDLDKTIKRFLTQFGKMTRNNIIQRLPTTNRINRCDKKQITQDLKDAMQEDPIEDDSSYQSSIGLDTVNECLKYGFIIIQKPLTPPLDRASINANVLMNEAASF